VRDICARVFGIIIQGNLGYLRRARRDHPQIHVVRFWQIRRSSFYNLNYARRRIAVGRGYTRQFSIRFVLFALAA